MNVPADPNTWDSDYDFYGYKEMEFIVEFGIDWQEDGSEVILTDEQLKELQNEYAELIEEKLWEELDNQAMMDDDYDDRYEPESYY